MYDLFKSAYMPRWSETKKQNPAEVLRPNVEDGSLTCDSASIKVQKSGLSYKHIWAHAHGFGWPIRQDFMEHASHILEQNTLWIWTESLISCKFMNLRRLLKREESISRDWASEISKAALTRSPKLPPLNIYKFLGPSFKNLVELLAQTENWHLCNFTLSNSPQDTARASKSSVLSAQCFLRECQKLWRLGLIRGLVLIAWSQSSRAALASCLNILGCIAPQHFKTWPMHWLQVKFQHYLQSCLLYLRASLRGPVLVKFWLGNLYTRVLQSHLREKCHQACQTNFRANVCQGHLQFRCRDTR